MEIEALRESCGSCKVCAQHKEVLDVLRGIKDELDWHRQHMKEIHHMLTLWLEITPPTQRKDGAQ